MQFAERIRVKAIDASKVIKCYADAVAVHDRRIMEEKRDEIQAVIQSYEEKIEQLKGDRDEARNVMEQAINGASKRDRIKDEGHRETIDDLHDILQRADDVTEIVKERLDGRARAHRSRHSSER